MESTCVMHPFSYTLPENHFHEESPMYGIGESVSFGRYVTEDLEWEKWSSFDSNNNRNRYVKEAEKYSKPGSVAQKKAYFEAHFKRMAALKAAALLEQANNATSNERVKVGDGLINSSSSEGINFEGAKMVGIEGENCDDAGEFVVHQNELYLIAVDSGENDEGGNAVGLGVINQNSCDKIEVYSAATNVEDWKASNQEKPLLQENSYTNEKAATSTATATAVTKKNPPLSSYILKEVDCRDKIFSFSASPAKSANVTHPGKENYATPVKKKSSVTDPDKKKTPLRMSINRELNRIISPVIKKLGSSSKASTPSKASVNSTPQPPSMTPDLTKRGASPSPSTGRNKISSPIIPNSFCLKNGDRTARRKQKLEDKFNATATDKPSQPSKFKVKAEAELNKFRQSFCFKAMSSPDYYGDIGPLRSPKDKNESMLRKSPSGGRQCSRTLIPQNASALPPRRPASKQTGLKSKRTLVTS